VLGYPSSDFWGLLLEGDSNSIRRKYGKEIQMDEAKDSTAGKVYL